MQRVQEAIKHPVSAKAIETNLSCQYDSRNFDE